MKAKLTMSLPIPASLAEFTLPAGVQKRLSALLDKQDGGRALTSAERREAEGLVEVAEFLSLLKLRTGRPRRVA